MVPVATAGTTNQEAAVAPAAAPAPEPAAEHEERRPPPVELPPEAAAKLDSGLNNDVVLEVTFVSERPPGQRVELVRCRVTFDAWDKVYLVRRAQEKENSPYREREDALRGCVVPGRSVAKLKVLDRPPP